MLSRLVRCIMIMLRSKFARKKKRQTSKEKTKEQNKNFVLKGIQVTKTMKYLWQSNSICMRFVLRQVCFDSRVQRINISTCLTAVIEFVTVL